MACWTDLGSKVRSKRRSPNPREHTLPIRWWRHVDGALLHRSWFGGVVSRCLFARRRPTMMPASTTGRTVAMAGTSES